MPLKGKTTVIDDEGNDLIPQDSQSPQDVDDLLSSIGTRGLDVLEEPRARLTARWNRDWEKIQTRLNWI